MITTEYKSNQRLLNRLIKLASKSDIKPLNGPFYLNAIGEWVNPSNEAESKALTALFESEQRTKIDGNLSHRIIGQMQLLNAIHSVKQSIKK